MMSDSNRIIKIYKDSFRTNLYTMNHFRMIGLIDVDILFHNDTEKVTLAFYSSSGINSGKIEGLWYPIVGIKLHSGDFTEFTPYINTVLTQTTRHGYTKKGWLAKSPFFYGKLSDASQLAGFSNGSYYESLLETGKTLRTLYETDNFHLLKTLSPIVLNQSLASKEIYPENKHTQQENFDHFISGIFNPH